MFLGRCIIHFDLPLLTIGDDGSVFSPAGLEVVITARDRLMANFV